MVVGQVDHRNAWGQKFQVKDGHVAAKDFAYSYSCPVCEGIVASKVKTGQVNPRSTCGNQFYVKDGKVVSKEPFCKGTVTSKLKTGQINHQSTCGNQFSVKDGQVAKAFCTVACSAMAPWPAG